MHRGIAESWPYSSTRRCVARGRSAEPPQTHTRVHTTMKLDECRYATIHISPLHSKSSLCVQAYDHACTQPRSANSPFKISLERQRHSKKMCVVGEVDMPQRREAQRKFWSVWCVWHWPDCSWTLPPAAGRYHLQLKSLVCVNHHHPPAPPAPPLA